MSVFHQPYFRLWSIFYRYGRHLYLFRVAWKNRRRWREPGVALYEVTCRISFEPRDVWIGLYWTMEEGHLILFFFIRSFAAPRSAITCWRLGLYSR